MQRFCSALTSTWQSPGIINLGLLIYSLTISGMAFSLRPSQTRVILPDQTLFHYSVGCRWLVFPIVSQFLPPGLQRVNEQNSLGVQDKGRAERVRQKWTLPRNYPPSATLSTFCSVPDLTEYSWLTHYYYRSWKEATGSM